MNNAPCQNDCTARRVLIQKTLLGHKVQATTDRYNDTLVVRNGLNWLFDEINTAEKC